MRFPRKVVCCLLSSTLAGVAAAGDLENAAVAASARFDGTAAQEDSVAASPAAAGSTRKAPAAAVHAPRRGDGGAPPPPAPLTTRQTLLAEKFGKAAGFVLGFAGPPAVLAGIVFALSRPELLPELLKTPHLLTVPSALAMVGMANADVAARKVGEAAGRLWSGVSGQPYSPKGPLAPRPLPADWPTPAILEPLGELARRLKQGAIGTPARLSTSSPWWEVAVSPDWRFSSLESLYAGDGEWFAGLTLTYDTQRSEESRGWVSIAREAAGARGLRFVVGEEAPTFRGAALAHEHFANLRDTRGIRFRVDPEKSVLRLTRTRHGAKTKAELTVSDPALWVLKADEALVPEFESLARRAGARLETRR